MGMNSFDISLGSLLGDRRGSRRRPLPLDQEQAAAAAPPQPGREEGLAGQIPSSLIETDQRARAIIIGGPPAWSRRLKRIETLTEAALAELEAAWRALARARRDDPARFASDWAAHAERFDFATVNDLIARHNRYFPAEANLAMNVRTRDFIGIGGGDYRRRPLDAAWVLERFPPELASALG
jgi:hypothetical protein